MSETVDARGLSCPQPVLMTMEKIKQLGQGQLLVLVDTQASKENVSRAVQAQGWEVRQISEDGDEFHLTITKS
ncbi:MAG: sulfurtransferase TusA family protein [Desulfohalobiaceae bacterium]